MDGPAHRSDFCEVLLRYHLPGMDVMRRIGHVIDSGKALCGHCGNLDCPYLKEMDETVPAHHSDFCGAILGYHLPGTDVMRRGLGTLMFLEKHLVNTEIMRSILGWRTLQLLFCRKRLAEVMGFV